VVGGSATRVTSWVKRPKFWLLSPACRPGSQPSEMVPGMVPLRQRGGRHQRPAPHSARDGHDRRDLPERWGLGRTAGHPAGLGHRQRHAVPGEHVDQPRPAPHPARRQHLGTTRVRHAWWTHEFRKSGHTVPAFYAWGWGGQVIAVFPEHDAVAVFTAPTTTQPRPRPGSSARTSSPPCSMPTRQASGRQHQEPKATTQARLAARTVRSRDRPAG
jgi:hypothetical protein